MAKMDHEGTKQSRVSGALPTAHARASGRGRAPARSGDVPVDNTGAATAGLPALITTPATAESPLPLEELQRKAAALEAELSSLRLMVNAKNLREHPERYNSAAPSDAVAELVGGGAKGSHH